MNQVTQPPHTGDFESHFKIFEELMPGKVRNILLVSSPYDAFILEENGSLATRIIHEYRGLNLSRPPKIKMASRGADALSALEQTNFDLVILMPNLEDVDTFDLANEIKAGSPGLPVILLVHSLKEKRVAEDAHACRGIDNIYVWTGDANLLLALVKNVEDRMNADDDTQKALVRVLILVEDSPLYRSVFLPLIYKVVVKQTQLVMEESLNEEHRLLKMRARPKILTAENFEQALELFERYRPYVFGVLSDTRYPRSCAMTADAGAAFLAYVKSKIPHLPILLLSSESENKSRAEEIQAAFIDKNSPDFLDEIQQFFLDRLGFGDFVFRNADKTEIGRASNLHEMEHLLPSIPDEPLYYHGRRNHFSNWLLARSETSLALKMAAVRASDFENAGGIREYLISSIHSLRKWLARGVIAQFHVSAFDPDIWEFAKIGRGSLGGKGRGLAFVGSLLKDRTELRESHPEFNIRIPKTLVLGADIFEAFIQNNALHFLSDATHTDTEITRRFLDAQLPPDVQKDVEAFLSQIRFPLSVRSSGLFEDAWDQAYSGLYRTYIIPNSHPDPAVRIRQMTAAIKLVYASTWFRSPLTFSRSTSSGFQKDSMAVIVQQAAGAAYGGYFYPAVSGVARSANFYPIAPMTADDGVAQIALGFGRIIDEEGSAVRFSPRYPNVMPEFSKLEDILKNAQRYFYALRINVSPDDCATECDSGLVKRDVADAENEPPLKFLSGTFNPDENRIRDTAAGAGYRVLTFARLLKYNLPPLPALLSSILAAGRKGMGAPVEIEFSLDLNSGGNDRSDFHILQMRPLGPASNRSELRILDNEIRRAFCFSTGSMGNGGNDRIADIVYVDPDAFDPAATVQIAREIGRMNAGLVKENRPYLLAGFGRWGSADRWLGIPVEWKDISGAAAIVETWHEKLHPDPSFGSHFFQRLTRQGIHYATVLKGKNDFFNWDWLKTRPVLNETPYVRHVRLQTPFTLKNDGRVSQCVMF